MLANGPRNAVLLEHSTDASCLVLGRRSARSSTSSAARPPRPWPRTRRCRSLGARDLAAGPAARLVVVGVDDSEYSAAVLQAAWAAATVARGPARDRARLAAAVRVRRRHRRAGARPGVDRATRTTADVLGARQRAGQMTSHGPCSPTTTARPSPSTRPARPPTSWCSGGTGTVGGSASAWAGSTVRTMLRAGGCPVMVVPSP